MGAYKFIIFDIDDTLLDFGAAYAAAAGKIAGVLGVRDLPLFEKADRVCGWRAWEECGLERTGDPDVQKNYHRYYMQYVYKHYAYLTGELQLNADPEEMTCRYLDAVTQSKVPMEKDTLTVYRKLAENHRLVLAGNGLTGMQTARTSAFAPYTYRIFISESVGAIKPTASFFDHVLRDLGCRPEECLMVGDSLSNDIRGAKAAGMDTCWYNPRGKTVPADAGADHVIGSIRELTDILEI